MIDTVFQRNADERTGSGCNGQCMIRLGHDNWKFDARCRAEPASLRMLRVRS